ncbi:MAG: hypothetical protein HQM13_19345 [SAR324 cluster bacterium]|nr:hypothetical protein [SAR324 cluster bacterium]
MKRTIFPILLLLLCLMAASSHGATVYLNSGESLIGRIQGMDDNTLTLESDRRFGVSQGVLQIDRADIRLIEFDGMQRDLSRKFGVGYYHRGPVAQEFNIGSASLKYWLNRTDAVDMLVGYGGTSDGNDKVQEIFNLEMRYTHVLLQEGNQDIYWGGGMGFVSVTDRETKTEDTGINIRALLGIEFFFVSFPNLGISGELGVTNQSVGDRTSFGVFTSGFPTMAVRYYF